MNTVYTEYDKLKEVIVGRELMIPNRQIDITFKTFYTSLSKGVYHKVGGYKINENILGERIEDLDSLAKTLEDLHVIVKRPNIVGKVTQIKTPLWSTILSSVSNVRDLTLVYDNKIIETPPLVRNRYLENLNLYSLYKEYMIKGSQWFKAPNNLLTIDAIDTMDWKEPRDYNNCSSKYDIGIDAAQYIKMGEDLLCNISTFNHYLGAKWVESVMPGVKIHYMYNAVDNHLDGAIMPLKEGTFLINNNMVNGDIRNYLPNKYKKWNFIDVSCMETRKNDINYELTLSSHRGMDMNILSINPETILVNDTAIDVITALEKNNFIVIPIKLRHSVLFGGGIHCSTLDVCREC